jgi:hypothetical protein
MQTTIQKITSPDYESSYAIQFINDDKSSVLYKFSEDEMYKFVKQLVEVRNELG